MAYALRREPFRVVITFIASRMRCNSGLSTQMTRYYLHGDKSEDDESLYYCAICDAFASRKHFAHHGNRNRERHDHSRARLRNLRAPYSRPKNPISLADEWPKAASPTRGSFYRWLRKQSDRDDPISDLSSDVARDKSFPSNSQSLSKLERHVALKGGCEVALTALREAFAEFLAKGNLRAGITPKLRFEVFRKCDYCCQLCGRKASLELTLEIDHKVSVSLGGTNDPDNLWVLCFDCNRGKSASEL